MGYEGRYATSESEYTRLAALALSRVQATDERLFEGENTRRQERDVKVLQTVAHSIAKLVGAQFELALLDETLKRIRPP